MTPPTVYALIVSVDDYPPPLPALRGCVADARAIEALLRDRVPADRLRIRTLTDSAATRAAVVAAFQAHLGQAALHDTALFWYAGHGSQQTSAAPIEIEPTGLDQTLVLIDSRQAGSADLADKELGALVAKVSAGGAHVVVGLDCCHSGSGTRELEPDVRARRAPADLRPPDLRPVLDGLTATPDSSGAQSGWHLAAPGRHILLAACRSDQTAKETSVDGVTRGVLSAAVEEALRAATSPLRYRDLHRRATATVRHLVRDQSPQLEVTDDSDAERDVLSGALTPRPSHYLLSWEDQAGWLIDAGAVHGIPAPSPAGTTRLLVYSLDADAATLALRDHALAEATVTMVEPDRSRVEVTEDLGRQAVYRAVVVSFPQPPLAVAIDVDPAAQPVRDALSRAAAGGPSPLLAEAVGDAALRAPLAVTVARGEFAVIDRAHGDAPVLRSASASDVLSGLEHIARWKRLAALSNPGSSLDSSQLQLDIDARDSRGDSLAERDGDEVRLRYDDSSRPPRFTVRVRNRTERPLYCGIAALSSSYAISIGGVNAGPPELLLPGQTLAVNAGRAITARVPDDLWNAGVTSQTDTLLLVASSTEFDLTVVAQPSLGQSWSEYVTRGSRVAANSLQRMLTQVPARALDFDSEDAPLTDWTTAALRITTSRPLQRTPIGADPGRLAPGVTVAPHPGLRAQAVLTSLPTATRDAFALLVPPLLLDLPDATTPFALVSTRSDEAPLDVLELTEIAGADTVTPQAPLMLHLDAVLGEDEHVLAITFDGSVYLPVGFVASRTTGGTQLRIDQLPPAISTRSLGSSVRLLFRRLIAAPLGLSPDVTRLAIATADPQSGDVRYNDNAVAIKDAVAAATRVGLLIHGIIGDTRGMVASSVVPPRQDAEPFGRHYDLLLAFDYENINTPVSETAQYLLTKLRAAGFASDDSTQLGIIAHSMGGLVARWMIERLDGAHLVDHLITLGTPNGGSPWPRIVNWPLATLTFGLNRLAAVFWPTSVLSGLVAVLEKVDIALDDMAPGSVRLQALFESPDPELPYTVLIGDRSLISSPQDRRIAAVVAALGPRQLIDRADALAFLGQPNDLAVAVTSAEHLPPGRKPSAELRTVACDHVTFFSSPAGLAALTQAIGPAVPRGPHRLTTC